MKNIWKRRLTKIIAILFVFIAGLGLAACQSAADRSAEEVSIKAENYEVQREIIGTNTRSGEVLFHYVGRCSLESGVGESALKGYLQIMCKHGPDDFRKHYERESVDLHISSAQLDPIDVSEYHTTYKFKPAQLVPNIELDLGSGK